MSDEPITTVQCRECGASVAPGLIEHCPGCKAPLLSSQRRTTQIALSHDFAKLGRDLCAKLEARCEVLGDAFAAEGATMVSGFLEWEAAMPAQSERSRQIQALADWQRKSLDYLTESKS